MTKRNAFAAKRRNDEFLENQTAWKNLPVSGHLNFILTALLSHICLKTEDLVQQTVNYIKTINFWMTNFLPSQIWINFRKSQEISRFSDKGIPKNFRSEISLCRFDTLIRNKGLIVTICKKHLLSKLNNLCNKFLLISETVPLHKLSHVNMNKNNVKRLWCELRFVPFVPAYLCKQTSKNSFKICGIPRWAKNRSPQSPRPNLSY